MEATPFIWHRGRLVPWQDATVHVLAHVLHYGSSVFEGIRAYDTKVCGTAIFRLGAHLRRLHDSARIYRMDMPHDEAELRAACHDVVRENGLCAAYIRPLVYRGYGSLGVGATDKCPVEVAIAAYRWGSLLGADSGERGVDVGVSSWRRAAPDTFPAMAKAGGNYINSQLMIHEARRHGYGEAIALDAYGYLSEGAAENVFVVRDGVVFTPLTASALLPGITRDTVITLARHLGYPVREELLPREALYWADEVFLCGTAAEITPVRSVDGLTVGKGTAGAITRRIQEAFFGLFDGTTEDVWGWLEPVPAAVTP
jgi:branched-chain amino acid aminotransferase